MKPRYRVTKFTSDGFVMVSKHQVLRCTVKAQITWKSTERVRPDRLWNCLLYTSPSPRDRS